MVEQIIPGVEQYAGRFGRVRKFVDTGVQRLPGLPERLQPVKKGLVIAFDKLRNGAQPESLVLTPEQLYPPRLEAQVEQFIDKLAFWNLQKPEHAQRDEGNYTFLRDFYKRLLTGRTARTYEVESPAYQEAQKLGNKQFPTPTYWVTCMDGRVLAVIAHGASANIGGSIRVPGGILREFVRGHSGRMKLLQNSTFASSLTAALEKSPTDSVTQVFDSHIGCLARNAEEGKAGRKPQDSGLYADVLHKREMAEATVKFVHEKYGDNRRVIPIQTSFNPHNGYLYMGLETDSALGFTDGFTRGNADKAGKDPNKAKPEYTAEMLDTLTKIGAIVSTEQLQEEGIFKNTFENHATFTINWKNDYVNSAINFWQAIDAMKTEIHEQPDGSYISALDRLKEKLLSVYIPLRAQTPEAQEELEERAMLLLTNAFSGFMHNRPPEGKKKQIDNGHKSHYIYDEHLEEFVKVYEGGQPPYPISAFVVFSLDKDNLPDNVELAASLVRENRRQGRVTDASGQFIDRQEFAEAVVPVVVQEIVRAPITEEKWNKFSSIDWSNLPDNWDHMEDLDFLHYLQGQGIDESDVLMGINDLRKRMAILYNPQIPTAAHLVDQYKVAVPTVSDGNRRNRFLVPFVKYAFSEN